MPIKFADDIIKEIINRGEISVKNNCVTGEEFEKWLRRENEVRGKVMENIRRWFENDKVNNGQNYEIDEYEGHLEARTDTVIFMVVEPHSGTRNRWLLRVSTRTAFDRWANSTAIEEFFDSDIELCNYLYDHQLDIYKDLVEYLSREYDEVTEEY